MELGINNHLRRISSELFIKYDAVERKRIDRSLQIIIENLEEYFDDQIDKCLVFGSYTRDTILPRQYDEHSDVDILIQFNTDDYDKLKPESYRNQLKKFSEAHYKNSFKDYPSIVIELNHIKFDLVPAIFDEGFLWDSIEIPDRDGGWMETKPDKFNKKLTAANKDYNSIVKPIVRLLKYWNASNSYPYYSYELETQIAEMDFSGDNYETGFLYAIKKLSTGYLPNLACHKVEMLRSNANRITEYLEDQNIIKAKAALEKILPGFNNY